ncbi:HNH endonuclease [Streptomyces sp. JJ36]|nr:HNH endonuclease [Streptomyces sp. JJ36]
MVLTGARCAEETDGASPPDPAPGDSAPASGAPSRDAPASGKLLDSLEVRPPGTMDGYARDRFPHWSARDGGCDTRDAVLRRDGTEVRTEDECDVVSGRWRSPFDGAEWTDPSDVDVDHVVPLAEAWRSGARAWDDARREEFANDMERPQLLAVTDNVNQEKGDSPPDAWKPPREGYWCTYARSWVTVKAHYELSVTTAEKRALRGMLDRCPA